MKKLLLLALLMQPFLFFAQNSTKSKQTKKQLGQPKLPFVGTKHFSFYGGSGQSVTILKDGKVILKDEPRREEPTIFWQGTYTAFCKSYKISGGYIIDLKCTPDNKETGFPCKARL